MYTPVNFQIQYDKTWSHGSALGALVVSRYLLQGAGSVIIPNSRVIPIADFLFNLRVM